MKILKIAKGHQMNKDNQTIQKLYFVLYNLFFHSSLSYFIAAIVILFVSVYIGYLCFLKNCNIDKCEEIITSVGFLLVLLYLIVFFIVKFISLPLIYKYTKNNFFKDFLEKLASEKTKNKIIILLKILRFDIVMAILSIIIMFAIDVIFLDASCTRENIIFCTKMHFIFWMISLGGVLPCYLSFLLWYKFFNKKVKKTELSE